MQDDDHPQTPDRPARPGFFAYLMQGLIRDAVGLWAPVVIGTLLGVVLCLWLGLPLSWSLIGGVIVLAVYHAWDKL